MIQKLLVLLTCFFAVTACSSNDVQTVESEQPEQKKAVTYQQILELIDNKSCQSASECQLIGVGARPCGGPDKYLVYSSSVTENQRLTALVSRFNQLAKEDNQKNNRIGICVVAEKPVASCQQNTCVANNDSVM